MAVPPSSLTQDCYVVPPPSEDDIVNAQQQFPNTEAWEARFLLMADYSRAQTDALGNCNKQLLGQREWIEKRTALEVQK